MYMSRNMKFASPRILSIILLSSTLGYLSAFTPAINHQLISSNSKAYKSSTDHRIPPLQVASTSPPSQRKSKTKYKIRTMFKQAKQMEKSGQWRSACLHFEKILKIDPYDSYTHLALGKLQSRREQSKHITSVNTIEGPLTTDAIANTKPYSRARAAFYNGVRRCPRSIHIWQAWAMHEESLNQTEYARYLFETALDMDTTNAYVCHGLGLLEQKAGNLEKAQDLWSRPLISKKGKATAALVCSLGSLMIAQGNFQQARELYMTNVDKITSEREVIEVYMAAAWLEEKYLKNLDRSEELLKLALAVNPDSSRAEVALARFLGRKVDSECIKKNENVQTDISPIQDMESRRNDAIREELKHAYERLLKKSNNGQRRKKSDIEDGRLFNAWAKLEVHEGNFDEARNILQKGMALFPDDHSLPQAAGKVEEHLGNVTGARDSYSASLLITPSAPTLVAYALLEIRHPVDGQEFNHTMVATLFDEALLLDPRHGPTYNAYGNMELKLGNTSRARQIFKNGVMANCRDVASVYHGLAMLELSEGNIDYSRTLLRKGLQEVRMHDSGMDNSRRQRAAFLTQSLGTIELNCNRPLEAKKIFESGIEQHGNSTQLLLGAAWSELKLGNDDAARNFFERSVNVDRSHAQAWQSWGVMEMRAGNYITAKTLFECGIKNDPNHGALWQAYANMESRRGNIEGARQLFAAGITKCPDHVPLYQTWACLELRNKNYDKARTLIGEALTRKKSQGSSWLVAAKIEEQLDNKGLVGLILQRGLKHAPHSVKLLCALAEYEVSRGKINVARQLLEKGLEIDPLHAPLYHSLAELEAMVFNIEGLAQLNKRAAKVFNANAMDQTPISMKMLGNKLRKSSATGGKIPNNIASLASMIEVEFDFDIEEEISECNPEALIEKMTDNDGLLLASSQIEM